MSRLNSNTARLNEGSEPGQVLIVAPTGRDALVVASVLDAAAVVAVPCLFPAMMQRIKDEATGALIVAEEALLDGRAGQLAQALRGQPPWSDLPLVVLLTQRRRSGADPTLPAGLGIGGLALLLERPLRKTSLVSTVRMALRARQRQYEVRDHINEHIRTAAALERAARNKDEFLAMLAHELRNPLGPIRTASALLQRFSASEPSIKQLSEMIARQTGHMTHLLDALLDVSRITSGKVTLDRQLLDAIAVVRDAVEIARPLMDSRGHELRLFLPSKPAWVEGDATRLAQVLGNLLINAAKYTPEGGQVTLSLRETTNQVIYEVRDNGIGINVELLPRIFELFSQAETALDRSDGGLGIGLAVVKGVVELHGGSVAASSEGPDKGAEFEVRLPRAEPQKVVHESVAVHPAPHTAQQRILVVDDNSDFAESIAMLLRLEGHDVRIALDGPSALEMVEEFEPTTALLDIGLPGLNGYELARTLRSRQNGRRMLLVAITGYGQLEDRVRSHEAGFDHHIVKPLDPLTLGADLARLAKERDKSKA